MPGFGERLRQLRGNRSQKEIAGQLEMPVTTYSTLENQEAFPRERVLKRLADFFAVQVSYFYSNPSPGMRSTESARWWLEQLRTSSYAQEKTITHADITIPEDAKKPIAERMKAIKDAKTSNKRRIL